MAELEKLNGEVIVSINVEQKAELGAFKLFKKKIIKKNVIIACTAIIFAVVLLGGTYLYLDSNITPIPYREGLIVGIEADPVRGVVDIVSSINPARKSAASINVVENGKIVRLVFVGFCETTISKWQNMRDANFSHSFRVVHQMATPQTLTVPEDKPDAYLLYEPFDRCEIYYTSEIGLGNINPGEDYQSLRREGLLWSGQFADTNLVASKSFALDNATEQQRAERMVQFSLYENGTMSFTPAISGGYIPPNCTYSVEGDEMVFRAIIKTEHEKSFFNLDNGDIVARFTIIDEDTLIFQYAGVALYAEPDGRYVNVYNKVKNGIIPDNLFVDQIVLDTAVDWVRGDYEGYRDIGLAAPKEYGVEFDNWRLDYIDHVYTYYDLDIEIYRFSWRIHTITPDKAGVTLVGGMDLDNEGWLLDTYPDSWYLLFDNSGDELKFINAMMENNWSPGDEEFKIELINRLE